MDDERCGMYDWDPSRSKKPTTTITLSLLVQYHQVRMHHKTRYEVNPLFPNQLVPRSRPLKSPNSFMRSISETDIVTLYSEDI
jgi:hypothetical protein